MAVKISKDFCGINVATRVEERHSNNPAFSKEIIVKVFAVASLILLNIITLGIPIVVYAIYKIGTRLANASWKKDNSTAIQNQAVESVNSTKSTNNENEFQSLLKEIKNAEDAISLQNAINTAFKEIAKKNEEIAKAAFENKEWKNLGIEQKIALVNKLKEEERDVYFIKLIGVEEDCVGKVRLIKELLNKDLRDGMLKECIKDSRFKAKFFALNVLLDALCEEENPAKADELIKIFIEAEIKEKSTIDKYALGNILDAYNKHSDSKKIEEKIVKAIKMYLNGEKENNKTIDEFAFGSLMNFIKTSKNEQTKDKLLNEIIEISKIDQKIQAANQLTKNKIEKLEVIIVAVDNNDDILTCINSLENISLNEKEKDDLFKIITVVCLDKNRCDWAIKSVVNIENIELKDSLLGSIIDSAEKNNLFIEMENALNLLSKEELRKTGANEILNTALREENFHAVIFVKKFLPEKFKEVAFLEALTKKAGKCNDSLILLQIKNCIKQLDDNDKRQELLNEIEGIIKKREAAVPLFLN